MGLALYCAFTVGKGANSVEKSLFWSLMTQNNVEILGGQAIYRTIGEGFQEMPKLYHVLHEWPFTLSHLGVL